MTGRRRAIGRGAEPLGAAEDAGEAMVSCNGAGGQELDVIAVVVVVMVVAVVFGGGRCEVGDVDGGRSEAGPAREGEAASQSEETERY